MKININPDTTDMNYRYKMDSVNIQHTGQGKNSYTVITNIIPICDMINTEPLILLNYMGNIMGTSVCIDLMAVKGHYTVDIIQNIIYQFIKFATLCSKCNIPELSPNVIKSNKNYNLHMKCSACGSSYELIGNNKINQKLVDIICKYYSVHEFVPKKGNMVVNEFASQII